MKKSISVNIPNPCTENWNAMTKTDQGKHCTSCNKVVIDFSGMSDEQIVEILLKQKGEKVCGNFYNTQIKRPILYIQQRSYPKWPAIAAMLIAGVFQLGSSTLSAQKEQQQLHSTKLAIEKNPQVKKEAKTEPASDSLTTYTIQVFEVESKIKLPGVYIEIDSIGTFVTDENGEVKLTIDIHKIPKYVHLQFSSSIHETQKLTFAKARLIATKRMEIYMKESERLMLRGDVMIDYNGN